MDSKKPGVLRHLRQKVMPHLRRDKASPSKSAAKLDHGLDHRMSSSVPDIRIMRQEYAHVSSRPQLQQFSSPCYSSPSTPLVKSARNPGGGGSGLRRETGGGGGGRDGWSEHTLRVPSDCTDWASSQESLNSVYEDSSPETYHRAARGMEPEELGLPEMMTVYSPDPAAAGVYKDSSQVHTLKMN